MAGMWMVAGSMLAGAGAYAAKNLGNGDTGVATYTETVIHSTVQCDVMRDYYFNVETGEWVGWASDPYVTNCIEVGGSGGGTQCPPGDMVCQCQNYPNHPNCQGSGDPGDEDDDNDCKRTPAKARLGFAVGASDVYSFVIPAEAPSIFNAPTGPPCGPGTCKDCRDERQAAAATIEANNDDCFHGWATDIANSRCSYGMTRRGEDPQLRKDVFLNGGEGSTCVDIAGSHICEFVPGYEDCVSGWLNGVAGHAAGTSSTITNGSGTSVGGKGSVPGFEINGSHTIEWTSANGTSGTTTLTPELGLNDVCQSRANAAHAEVLNAYEACVRTATDKVNGSCNGTNANTGTN